MKKNKSEPVDWDPKDTNYDHGLSYQEWNDAGYYVMKGQHSLLRDANGVPLFLPSQVHPKPVAVRVRASGRYRGRSLRRHQTLWEECTDRVHAKGTPSRVIEDFDSFVHEAGMLPDLNRRRVFAIHDPLEMHFMNVADKHGVLDAILNGYDEKY